jgi:hypothetical protein
VVGELRNVLYYRTVICFLELVQTTIKFNVTAYISCTNIKTRPFQIQISKFNCSFLPTLSESPGLTITFHSFIICFALYVLFLPFVLRLSMFAYPHTCNVEIRHLNKRLASAYFRSRYHIVFLKASHSCTICHIFRFFITEIIL